MLRRAREGRGLSLADAERLTKIRAAYLVALEEERFAALPPRPYATGFVRTYALAVGLDPRSLLAAFESHIPPAAPAPLSEAVEIPLEPAAPPSRLRRLVTLSLWLLIPLLIVVALIGYVQLRDLARSGPGAAPSPAPLAPTGTPAPAPSPTSAAGLASTPEPTPATASSPAAPQEVEGIALALTASGTSWLRVTADGTRVFQGTVYAGDARTWTAQRELVIKIGDAAVVELVVNGRHLGVLGRPREVVTLRFPAPLEEP